MSNLRFKEQSTTPADASAGQVQMYAKTDAGYDNSSADQICLAVFN